MVSIRLYVLLFAATVFGAGMLGIKPASAGALARQPNITTAATKIAHTSVGSVGYREVGRGPILLMIMGFGASMDAWPPYLVDGLATHFRVVVFDNAGVGESSPLPSPLSVPQMAAETSALIRTLGLGRCDVLGWSMGGLIAQALAVTHPRQVRRLVLTATQPGTGGAAPSSSTARAALMSGSVWAILHAIFPPGQINAVKRYAAGVLAYHHYYAAPIPIEAYQQAAIDQWLAGHDASGRHPGDIEQPTLVADGTEDTLDPVRNDRTLARLIPHADLDLYSDAGHAFLFQDASQFAAKVIAFLD